MRHARLMFLAGSLALAACPSAAETATLEREVEKLQACLAGEWTVCLPDLLDPVIVDHFGGLPRLREAIRLETDSYEQKGIVVDSAQAKVRVNSPIVTIGELQYASLESRLPVVHEGKRLVIHGTIIAVSRDKGQSWRFVRPAERQRDLMERLYPGLWERMGITGPKIVPGG